MKGIKQYVLRRAPGNWGSALAYAASLMNLKSVIFWVRFAYNWKPSRRTLMKLYGAEVLS